MIFNDRLKILRKENARTQDTTAKDLGMPVRSYQRLEMDGAKTHYDTLLKIADYYDVSVDWLMGRTDKREVNRKSLPPSRGKVARPQAVTDEGAARLSPLTVRTACPPRPLIRPLRGHLPPGGWKAFPCGGRRFGSGSPKG